MEPAVKLDLAEQGSAAEREYWKEFEQANKVTYHPYVLWRRRPYQGELLAIDQNGIRRTLAFSPRLDSPRGRVPVRVYW